MDHGLVKCCLTCTETVDLLGTGAQDVHLDFHTAPEPLGHVLEQSPSILRVLVWRKTAGAGIAQWLERRTRD